MEIDEKIYALMQDGCAHCRVCDSAMLGVYHNKIRDICEPCGGRAISANNSSECESPLEVLERLNITNRKAEKHHE